MVIVNRQQNILQIKNYIFSIRPTAIVESQVQQQVSQLWQFLMLDSDSSINYIISLPSK